MNIKNRLDRLEALDVKITEPLKIGWFSVLPGLDDPIGYIAENGVVTMRGIGETMENLRDRCYEAVVWIPGQWHDFEAIP